MTVDEIKEAYTMRDILAEHGIKPNRAGFIRCPFHNEKTASMKIYKNSAYCFGCGHSADIIGMVQELCGYDFKTAFKSLGGTYEEQTPREREKARHEREMAAETRRRREERLKTRKADVLWSLHVNRLIKANTEPFSDLWCRAVNGFENDYMLLEEINNKLRGTP